jgi:hypothetical protein
VLLQVLFQRQEFLLLMIFTKRKSCSKLKNQLHAILMMMTFGIKCLIISFLNTSAIRSDSWVFDIKMTSSHALAIYKIVR